MHLLDDALLKFKKRLLKSPVLYGDLNDDRYRRWHSGDYGPDESYANVRLDWELTPESFDERWDDDYEAFIFKHREKIADLMFTQVAIDMADLIENGDVFNFSDPLLKVLDGSKKRGKQPVDIDFLSANLIREFKPRKDTTEYTLLTLFYVRWA